MRVRSIWVGTKRPKTRFFQSEHPSQPQVQHTELEARMMQVTNGSNSFDAAITGSRTIDLQTYRALPSGHARHKDERSPKCRPHRQRVCRYPQQSPCALERPLLLIATSYNAHRHWAKGFEEPVVPIGAVRRHRPLVFALGEKGIMNNGPRQEITAYPSAAIGQQYHRHPLTDCRLHTARRPHAPTRRLTKCVRVFQRVSSVGSFQTGLWAIPSRSALCLAI